MLGAITGDIIGSVYEFDFSKPDYDFPLFTEESFFTDDTVLTVALADSILSGTDYKTKMLEYYSLYPDCSYGNRFHVCTHLDVYLHLPLIPLLSLVVFIFCKTNLPTLFEGSSFIVLDRCDLNMSKLCYFLVYAIYSLCSGAKNSN